MKFVLIFLSAYVVAISHQQFQQRPSSLLWWSPYYQPLPVDREENFPFYRQLMRRPSRPPPYFSQNVDFNSDLTELINEPNDVVSDGFIPGAQSRIKSSNHFLQNNQQSQPRFLYNYGFYNPFFKTATFTLTSTITLAAIQTCVPRFQVGARPVACRRKRNEIQDFVAEPFSIVPSETLKLTPTELASAPLRELEQISSSKDDDTHLEKMPTTGQYLREKRVFFINKNKFVVSSTVTSYSFVSTTVLKTVNLINPAPVAPCAAAPVLFIPQCVACLPAGFIVCPAD